MSRDYSFEALAEVTSTDWNAGRGELNAALKSIREQAEIEDSYLLNVEIHDRAKLYLEVFPTAALTPTALAKHWARLPEEAKKLKRGGTNLHAHAPGPSLPISNRDRNLAEVQKLKETLWPR